LTERIGSAYDFVLMVAAKSNDVFMANTGRDIPTALSPAQDSLPNPINAGQLEIFIMFPRPGHGLLR
jgi:hypothetical protein